MRISNFLLWQLAYTELYFTDVNWPDFNKDELYKALADYQQRERRFGLTSDQLKSDTSLIREGSYQTAAYNSRDCSASSASSGSKGELSSFYRFYCPCQFHRHDGVLSHDPPGQRRCRGYCFIVLLLFSPVCFTPVPQRFTTFAIAFLFLAFSIYTLFSFKDIKSAASEAALLFFGVMYIPYLLGYLVLLRSHPLGFKWILLIMFIVMSCDSAAYFIGCRYGKRRLYPEVSPKKSVEGCSWRSGRQSCWVP